MSVTIKVDCGCEHDGNHGHWLQEQLDRIEATLARIEAAHSQQPGRVVRMIIGQEVPEGSPEGENPMAITMTNEGQVPVGVSAVDADGHTTPVTGLAVTVGGDPVVTVTVNDDGQGFVVHSIEPANPGDPTNGVAALTVTIDGVGADGGPLSVTEAVEVISSGAVGIQLMAGPETPENP